MGLRRWALVAAGVTLMSALVLSLGATKASAILLCAFDPEGSGCGPAPYVTGVSPQDGATGVSRMTDIMVTFSEEVRSGSVNTDTFKLYLAGTSQQIPATVYRYDLKTYALDPYSGSRRLDPNAKYRVVVTSGVEDHSGKNMYPDKVWYFTTAPASAPYVTQVSPPDGATGVSMSTNIKVTFSEAMDPATINGSTFQLRFYDVLCNPYTRECYFSSQQIPATVSKDPTDTSGRTYVLDPSATTLSYANKRYQVWITTGVRDIEDGLQMSSNKTSYFKTGSY